MWLFILEAGGAMGLLVFIVWWTMFSGQKSTPPAAAEAPREQTPPPQPALPGDNQTANHGPDRS